MMFSLIPLYSHTRLNRAERRSGLIEVKDEMKHAPEQDSGIEHRTCWSEVQRATTELRPPLHHKDDDHHQKYVSVFEESLSGLVTKIHVTLFF